MKGWPAHLVRHLVGARAQLVGISIDLSNQIRSLPKTFGLRVGGGAGRVFEAKDRGLVEGKPVASVVEPLLAAWRAVRDQVAVLDRKLSEAARGDATCRLPMTCPGGGRGRSGELQRGRGARPRDRRGAARHGEGGHPLPGWPSGAASAAV